MINKFEIVINYDNGKSVTEEITDELTIKKLNALDEQDIDVCEAISSAVNELAVGKEGIVEVEHEIEEVKSEILKLESVDEAQRAALDEKLKDLEDKRDSLLIK